MKSSYNTSDESSAMIAKASELFAKADWVELFQFAQDWTRKNADSPDAHYFFSVALFKRRAVKEAIASLQKCLELKPEHAGALDQLGVIICQQRRSADALPLHQKATSLDPQNSKLWFNLGVAYSRNGDDPNSEKAFRKAMEIGGPEQTVVRRLLAALINQQKHSEAEKLLSDLQATHPMIVQGITLPNPQSATGYVSFARDEIVPEPVTRSSPVRAVFQEKVLPDDEHELVRVVFAQQRNNKHRRPTAGLKKSWPEGFFHATRRG